MKVFTRIRKDVGPVLQQVAESFYVFVACVFAPEDGFIRQVEVKQTAFCQSLLRLFV